MKKKLTMTLNPKVARLIGWPRIEFKYRANSSWPSAWKKINVSKCFFNNQNKNQNILFNQNIFTRSSGVGDDGESVEHGGAGWIWIGFGHSAVCPALLHSPLGDKGGDVGDHSPASSFSPPFSDGDDTKNRLRFTAVIGFAPSSPFSPSLSEEEVKNFRFKDFFTTNVGPSSHSSDVVELEIMRRRF